MSVRRHLAQGNQLQVEDLTLDPNAESIVMSEPEVRTVSPVFSTARDPLNRRLNSCDAYEAGCSLSPHLADTG